MAEPTEGHEELVKVFDTDEESEAMVVRGLLESAGIDAMIQNREAPQDILPGVGGVVILVRPDQAEEAVATIEAVPQHILRPTPTKRSARNRLSRHRFSIQIERNSSGQVGAVGLDVRVGESPHHLRPGMLERVVEVPPKPPQSADSPPPGTPANWKSGCRDGRSSAGRRADFRRSEISQCADANRPPATLSVAPYCMCRTSDSSSCAGSRACHPG